MGYLAPDLEAEIARQLARAAHARARRDRWTGAIGTLVLTALVWTALWFGPRLHLAINPVWVLVAYTATPWIGFVVATWRSIDCSVGLAWADKYVAWITLTCFLTFGLGPTFEYIAPLQRSQLIQPACIGGLLLFCLVLLLDPVMRAKSAAAGLVFGCFACILYSAVAAYQVNCLFDLSPAAVYQTVVLRPVPRLRDRYWVRDRYSATMKIAAWAGRSGIVTAFVPRQPFASLQSGDAVCVVQRQGRLDMPWYTVQPCPWNPGPVPFGGLLGSR